MMTKEERKNVNEELVALLLSFSEKQTAAILKAVTQDHFWDLPESEQVELLRRCIHEQKDHLAPGGRGGYRNHRGYSSIDRNRKARTSPMVERAATNRPKMRLCAKNVRQKPEGRT